MLGSAMRRQSLRSASTLAATTFGPAGTPGFVAGPAGGPGVIAIQEWWGVNQQMLEHGDRLAAQGFRVLIPDLYKGEIGVDAEEAFHQMGSLDFPGAVDEICQAAAFLKAEGSHRVGVTGFCMGGALTMGGLAASPDLVCGAPFYGINFDLFDVAAIKQKPVQAHFGALDAMEGFSDLATAEKLRGVLAEGQCEQFEVLVYEGVGHAFMNSGPGPFESFEARTKAMDEFGGVGAGFVSYDDQQAELAWSRLFDFFKKHLA